MKDKESASLMGKVVTVHAELHRKEHLYRDGENREWHKIKTGPRAGWVVGVRSRRNGTYRSGGYDDQSELIVKSTVRCLLVAYWPTMNYVNVPLDGYAKGGTPEPPRQPEWPEKWREDLRRTMKNVPRDKNGRWRRE